MRQIPYVVAEVNRKVQDGLMDSMQAFEKIDSVVAGERRHALQVLQPYPAFRDFFGHRWFHSYGPLREPVIWNCPDDAFHKASIRFARVFTEPATRDVVGRIKRADKLCVVFRSMNDRRYDEASLGMVGLIAKDWDVAFFFFPFSHPLPAAVVAEVIGHKPLHCVNKSHAESLMGSYFRFVEVSPTIPVGRQRGRDDFPIADVIDCQGVRHCAKHSCDRFVDPDTVSNAALAHASAELFFLRRAAFP